MSAFNMIGKKKDVKSDLQGTSNMPGLFVYCFKKTGGVIHFSGHP